MKKLGPLIIALMTLKNIINNEKGEIFMKTNIKDWAKAAGIRAIKTVAQTAVATIGVSAVMSDVNWVMVGSASLLAGVLSILTSVAGLPEMNSEGED